MSPRVAGTAAMVAALALAVVAGFLIGHPPWSIPGAVLLVAASILFCVGALWSLRRTWEDQTWPPNVAMDRAKALRTMYRFSLMMCFFGPLMIAGGVVAIILGDNLVSGIFIVVLGVFNLATSLWRLRLYRRLVAESSEAEQ